MAINMPCLVPKAGIHTPPGRDQGVVFRDEALLVGGALDVHIAQVPALHHDQAVLLAHLEQLHRVVPELGREDAIARDGGAAALGVPEDDIARLDLGPLLDLVREPLCDPAQADGFGRVLDDAIDDLLAAFGFGALRRGDDRESFPAL